MLLAGRQEGTPPVKNWEVGCWRGYLSGAMCRFAYGPADATATHCLLLQWNSDWFLPFWYRLTWVVPDKGPLNGCVCCFCNVCSVAVRHHPEYRKATDTVIDAVVREWLRTAGDQDGGRKYRYHRSQSQPVSDGHQQRTMLGDRVFPVTAARAWNALASSVRSAS